MQEKNENITKIKERILQYIDLKGIKKEDFYKKVEIDGANFRGKNLKSELSSDKIVKIFRSYPELSLYWLILGEGEMLRDERPQSVGKKDDRDETKELLREKIKDQQKIIELLEEKVEALKGEIALQEGVASAGAAG